MTTSASCPACASLGLEPALRGSDRMHGTPGAFEVAVCTRCGSGRTFPPVSPEELGSLYPEPYNAYGLPRNPVLRAAASLLYRWRYRRALGRGALHAVAEAQPGRLLDVGSGRGDLGVVLGKLGWDVTGLEPSKSACAEARSRGASSEHGTLQTAAGRLPRGYDAVVFQHSLEHVVEPADDLSLARGLLRNGGLLIVSVPNFGCWQRRRFGADWFHLDLPRHRSHLTRQGLDALLRRSGFSPVSLTTSTSADGLPMSVQYRIFGRRRLERGVGLYANIAVTLVLAPLTAAINAVAGDGDVLHAVAAKLGDAE
jgi:SAM-dependent methyltransferase